MIICHILSYTRACTRRKKEEREKKRGREKSSTRSNTSREDPELPKASAARGPAGWLKILLAKISYVGSTHSPFRHVRQAANQAGWASRRLRSRLGAVLGPEMSSMGSY